MAYATKIDGEWVEKTPRQFRDERNASIPAARLEEEGLFEIAADPRPTNGQIAEPGPIVERDGRPVRTWLSRDATSEEIEQVRARKRRQVNAAYSRAMRPISDAYPVEERQGWQEQVQAAWEVKGGKPNPLIDALRAGTEADADAIADTIIGLRDQYLAIYGRHTGAKRTLNRQINAAATLVDLEAIDIDEAFTA